MSKYFYNNCTIDDYIVNTKGESKTADYCITNMNSSYTSKAMKDYKYYSSNDNIINYISVSIPYTTSSSPTGNLYSIKSSSPATITAPDGHVIVTIEGTKFTSSNNAHGTNYVTISSSIASNRKTATISLGGSIQGTSGSALMTVNCTVTYSASKNYLTLPENDCRFLVSEEMQKGYHIDDFVNKLTTPYLPFFKTADNVTGLELRRCDYTYNNMMQRYWEDLGIIKLQLSINDLINYPEILTITKINQRTESIVGTETIQLASPILYIIVQAAGGNGGTGYSKHPSIGWDSVYAGGAGGSGAAFIIAVDVVKALKDYTNITIYSHQVWFGNNDYIKADSGEYGKSANDTDNPRAGGTGGTFTIIGDFKDKNYITVCGTNGTAGTSGTGGTNKDAPNNIYRQASGNTSRATPFHITDNYIMHNIYPYSNAGILLQEDPTGLGEPVPYMSNPAKEDMLAGGPGGAPSPLFPGKSHPNNTNVSNTNWPGAGGCGQSGWYNMGEPDLQDCNRGGPAAVWLFYVATDNVCDTNNYDHEYEEKTIITWPTCTSEGKREVVCPRCKKTEIQTIPVLSHTWDNGDVIEAPTCTSEGIELYTCTVCGETKTITLDREDHSIYLWEETTDYYYRRCNNCSYREELGYPIYIRDNLRDYIKKGSTLTLSTYSVPEMPPSGASVSGATGIFNKETGEITISNPTGKVTISLTY